MAVPNIKNGGAAFTSNTANGASSVTLTKPTGANAPAVGDLAIILVANDDNSNTNQWDNSTLKPTGFTNFMELGSAVSDCHVGAFWREIDGTEGATVNVPSADTANQVGYYIIVEGADGTAPIDVSGGSVITAASSITPGAVTTTVDDCLAIAWQAGDGGDLTPVNVTGTGWTKEDDIENGTGGTDVSGCWATKEIASAGTTGSPTFDFDGSLSDGCCAFIFAIAPGAGGGLDLVRVVGEIAQGAEARVAPRDLARLLAESASLAEGNLRVRARAQATTETAQAVEAQLVAQARARISGETLQTDESTTRSRGLARIASDTLEAAEALVNVVATSVVRVVAETSQIAEDAIDSIAALVVQAVAETLQGAESLARTLGLTRARDETGQSSEATETSRALSRPVAETSGITEAPLVGRAIARLAAEVSQIVELRLRIRQMVRPVDESSRTSEASSTVKNFAEGVKAVIRLFGKLNTKISLTGIRKAVISLTGKIET